MKMKEFFIYLLLFGLSNPFFGQDSGFDLDFNISFGKDVQDALRADGRLFIFLNKNSRLEPRKQTWPSQGNHIFAKNLSDVNPGKDLQVTETLDWTKTPDWSLDNVPEGTYYVQVLWDQDKTESRINAPGNLFSAQQKIAIDQSMKLDVELNKLIEERPFVDHNLVRYVEMQSDTLSKWWGKPMLLKASVLLPTGYTDDHNVAYPIRYNIAGYGGRYNRVNNLMTFGQFKWWWESEESPQIITVFLDGEGPFGDSYQMDSENSGPYGHALIHEFIPFIEKQFRGTNSAETRFVDGCSTGGWVSLGLQLYYPDVFNGVFAYSPDAVEFENYQLINIYADENAYINEYGLARPVRRSIKGEPMMTLKEYIQYENVLGASNTYLNSGGQFSAHTALYSPKGENGLPRPMFDPVTGQIDHNTVHHWKKYDFKLYAQKHWEILGPKLQGKIFIWMGDMDQYYLNIATRAFAEFLEERTNPVSDAEIIFSPMQGHCQQFSHKEVLLKIEERVTAIQAER